MGKYCKDDCEEICIIVLDLNQDDQLGFDGASVYLYIG